VHVDIIAVAKATTDIVSRNAVFNLDSPILGLSGLMTLPASKVWEQIEAAFPAVLPSQPITTCDCEECRDVRATLGHLRWTEVLPPAIEKHFGSLPLLTDEAFHALLPAFLFRALHGGVDRVNKFFGVDSVGIV
jgi:hypothetical protein